MVVWLCFSQISPFRRRTARVSTNEGHVSMTALQDWLSDRPLDPRSIKTLIREAICGLSADEPHSEPEPTLMGRGLERC